MTVALSGQRGYILVRATCASAAMAYDTRDAKAYLVIARVELQRYEQGPPPCHAQIADLITLGFEVVGGDPHQRSVRFEGELYVEGYLQAVLVQASDKLRKAQNIGRSNGTKAPTESN